MDNDTINLGLLKPDFADLEQKIGIVVSVFIKGLKPFSGKAVKDTLRAVYPTSDIRQEVVSRAVHRIMNNSGIAGTKDWRGVDNGTYIEYTRINQPTPAAKFLALPDLKPNLLNAPVGGVAKPEQLGYPKSRYIVTAGAGIQLWNMNSSSLHDAGYSENGGMLVLSFNTNPNRLYVRRNVPLGVWIDLLESDSRGEYYHQYIKEEFDVVTSELV